MNAKTLMGTGMTAVVLAWAGAASAQTQAKDEVQQEGAAKSLAPATRAVELTIGTGYEQGFGNVQSGQPSHGSRAGRRRHPDERWVQDPPSADPVALWLLRRLWSGRAGRPFGEPLLRRRGRADGLALLPQRLRARPVGLARLGLARLLDRSELRKCDRSGDGAREAAGRSRLPGRAGSRDQPRRRGRSLDLLYPANGRVERLDEHLEPSSEHVLLRRGDGSLRRPHQVEFVAGGFAVNRPRVRAARRLTPHLHQEAGLPSRHFASFSTPPTQAPPSLGQEDIVKYTFDESSAALPA